MCEGISVSVSVSLCSAHRQLFDRLKLGLMKGLVCGTVNTELCSKILYREIKETWGASAAGPPPPPISGIFEEKVLREM